MSRPPKVASQVLAEFQQINKQQSHSLPCQPWPHLHVRSHLVSPDHQLSASRRKQCVDVRQALELNCPSVVRTRQIALIKSSETSLKKSDIEKEP